MKIKKMRCHFCTKEIDPRFFESGLAVLLRSPAGDLIAAHVKHHGVMEEYDHQLEIKNRRK